MRRKKYSKELKARIALDAIKGQKTIAELASGYGVHANQISLEIERDHLYKKVGQLQNKVDWLKKDRLSGMSVSEEVKCIVGRN
jgi:transposase